MTSPARPAPRAVAFLRAINVGGRNVTMARLRALFEELGLGGVSTFLASGNVIFDTPEEGLVGLDRRIELNLKEHLGYEVVTFLRTEAEVAAVAAHRAFPATEMQRAGALNVAFLTGRLPAVGRRALSDFGDLETDIDRFHVHGREVYWLCRVKQSESTFSNALFERRTGVKATFRSLSTVRKLAARLVAGA